MKIAFIVFEYVPFGLILWLCVRKTGLAQFLAKKYAACPACGWRLKEMKFSADARKTGEKQNEQGMLVNRCQQCKAVWIREPDVPWAQWSVILKSEPFDEQGTMVQVLDAAMKGKVPQAPRGTNV